MNRKGQIMVTDESNQEMEFPAVDEVKQSVPKRGRAKKSRIYYKEDIAGLWIYIQVGETAKLLTPYPITLLGEKAELKDLIDAF